MLSVLQQVIPCQLRVFVIVQFKETAVENIEVFVAEVFRDSVDVCLLIDMHELVDQIGAVQLTKWDLSCATEIDFIKDSSNYGERIFPLELVMILQEF